MPLKDFNIPEMTKRYLDEVGPLFLQKSGFLASSTQFSEWLGGGRDQQGHCLHVRQHMNIPLNKTLVKKWFTISNPRVCIFQEHLILRIEKMVRIWQRRCLLLCVGLRLGFLKFNLKWDWERSWGTVRSIGSCTHACSQAVGRTLPTWPCRWSSMLLVRVIVLCICCLVWCWYQTWGLVCY